jgi:mannose-1-phosphate guanylyltransferase
MKTVLHAAGFGSRLWPLSTSEKPKQFRQLVGEQSLLQYGYALFRKLSKKEELYVSTLRGLEYWVYEQLPDIPRGNVLVVPERRNTLPHTLAALKTIADSPDEVVLFSATDVLVTNANDFIARLKSYADAASSTAITIVVSTKGGLDSTAGYAQIGNQKRVTRFLEKPDLRTLKKLSKAGNTYKNTFVYMTSITALENALQAQPDERLARRAHEFLAASPGKTPQAFLDLPFCDISSTVFQYAPNMVGCVVDSDFIDIGKFNTLYQLSRKDSRGNAIQGNVLVEPDCKNNLVINQLDQSLVVVGMNNCVIVQTPDGSLCAPLQEADRIGEIYKQKIHGHEQ